MGPRGCRLRLGAALSFLRPLPLLNLYFLMQGRGSWGGPAGRCLPEPCPHSSRNCGKDAGGEEEGEGEAVGPPAALCGGVGPGRNLPGEAAMCQRCLGCGQKTSSERRWLRPLASRYLGKAPGRGTGGRKLSCRGAAFLRNENVLL